MSAPILATKLSFPPPRRNLVPRPRLTGRLAAGLQGPFTLISAPPGCGKTTLLSEWRAGPGREATVAWLALDEGDDDPVRFLQCLLASQASLRPGIVEGTALLLQPGALVPPEAILTSLINELSAACSDLPGGVVLVLDDYHVITAPPIHDALTLLLAHLPQPMHLVILSREDPPLPLSKLRVRGQLAEIREGDLRFTAEEAGAFLTQTMGLHLSEAGIASLAQRTEGWVAALQMARLSLQNRGPSDEFITAFRGDNRYVMDYLMDEVFRRQPAPIQEFLLSTSILERLCTPLCDEVAAPLALPLAGEGPGVGSSQAILEHLERANLFAVALDNRREWYRYHNLFADLLHYRLQRAHPERLAELHRRAGLWHAQAGDPDEAMRYALAVPDLDLVADLAEQYMLSLIGSSRIAAYLGWVQHLPEEVISHRAHLCAGCGWAYVLVSQPEAAQRYAALGEAALPGYEPVASPPEGRRIAAAEVAGTLMAIRSYADRLQGNTAGAIELAQRALATLPPEADAIRCAVALNLGLLHLKGGQLEPARQALGEAFEAARRSRTNAYVAITALSQLGGIAATRGKLREADSLFQRAMRYAADEAGLPASTPGLGIIHGWLMWLHYQRNEIAAAQEHLDRVLQAAGQMGVPETTARALIYQARLAQCRGDYTSAEAWFARVEELARVHPLQGLVGAEWAAFRAQHSLLQGDSASASALLEAQGLKASDLEQKPAGWLAPRLPGYVLLARVLAGQGAGPRADALLEQVCTLAEAVPNIEVLLQALAVRAVIAGSPRGLAHLQRALDMAAPESFARPFLDAGGGLAGPLRQAIMQGIQPAFASSLLADLAEDERRRAVAGQAFEVLRDLKGLIEPLTERERQVLRLLAAGLSSTEVAEELVISVSTARSYIKSLYGKLGAHNRDEAIEKGRQVGLI